MKMYRETRTRHLAPVLLAAALALLLVTGVSLLLTRSQVQAQPGMEITAWTRSKTVNRTVAAPGDVLTYTIMVRSDDDFVTTWLTDTLPTQVTYVPGSLQMYGPGTVDVMGDTITWNATNFGFGMTVYITFSAQIDPGITYDVFANTAQITGTGELVEFSSEETTVVTVIGNLDNEYTYKTVDPQEEVEPGDVLTYTVNLTNGESDPVPGVQVVDELPPSLSLVGGSIVVDEGSYVAQNDTITWTLDMGGNWGNIDLVFQAEVLEGGLVTNTAKLTAPGHQPLTLTSPAVDVYQRYANLVVEKTVSPDEGYPGDILTYIVHIANTGDGPAETVWMTDVLPSEVVFQSGEVSRGDYDVTDGVITWEVSPGGTVVLPAMEEAAMTFTVQISPDINSSVEFVNTAVVTGAGTLVQSQVSAWATTTSYSYWPFMVKRWPPVPYPPTLLEINNADQDENYTVEWVYNYGGVLDYYQLQEATDANFTINVKDYYPGTTKSYNFTAKDTGTYYYRVRGRNSHGFGSWSNVESTSVVLFSYFDDFSDYKSGWTREWSKTRGALYEVHPYEHPECPGDDCEYNGDGYVIARRKTDEPYARFGPGVTIPAENYEIEYDARWWDAQYHATYKVFFGSNSSFTEYYSLDVFIDDPSVLPSHCSYRLLREDGGGEHVIKNWQQEGEIDCHVRSQDSNISWNHWKIRREDNLITIFVNGEELGSWYDSKFGANRYFGVGCTLYEGLTPSKPEFDNWSVEILP